MKNILTKKKFVALFATVCAFVLLLVGIPFAAAPASAAENYTINQPSLTTVQGYAAVKRVYTGDIAASNQKSTWLRFGDTTNTNISTKTVEGSTYYEVGIPQAAGGGVGQRYFWVAARTLRDGVYYDSDARFFSPYLIDMPLQTVTGKIISGNYVYNSYIDIPVPSSMIITYVSFVYNGECYDFIISGSAVQGEVIGVEISTRNAQVKKTAKFKYYLGNGVLSILSPWIFTGSDWSAPNTQTGGVAWSIVTY